MKFNCFFSKDTQYYDEIMNDLTRNILRLTKENTTDERIIVPLYKTLDFLLECEEFTRWKTGTPIFSSDLFAIISQDTATSKSINKLLAVSGLSVGIFTHVSKEFKKNVFLMLSKLLTHK